MKPTGPPLVALIRAIRPAQSGATALVPKKNKFCPSTRTCHPDAPSASPLTSGVPRLRSGAVPPDDLVSCRPFCQAGSGKTVLTPPPVAPKLSFQTTSLKLLPEGWRPVPPQASACGLEAGKST